MQGESPRLVYEVLDGRLIVLVVAVGKRDKNAVYKAAEGRRHLSKSRAREKAAQCPEE